MSQRPTLSLATRLLFALLLACVMASAHATTYTIIADRDAFIKQANPNENHDTESEVELRSDGSNAQQRRPLFGFTLPSIPSNEQITSASLQLFVSRHDAVTATVRRVTDSWTEATVTWANTGTDLDSTVIASFSPSIDEAFVSIDITTLAQAWADGTYANNGVVIVPQTADTDVKFRSLNDGDAAEHPRLVITTARIVPALTVVKSSSLVSDPLNGTTNPKAIPGAVVNYSVSVTNTNAGTADAGTSIITDAVPTNMRLYVGDVNGVGSGPVAFTNGSPTSGLTYTFTSLSSAADSLSFSNNGGATFTYTPTPDANGYDSNVTHFRVSPSGTFAGASAGNNPNFQLQMRMQVR